MPKKKRELKDEAQITVDANSENGVQPCQKSMNLGTHDQMMVVMEQRWTGLCVAGIKIPQTGIAQLDASQTKVTDGSEKNPHPKLIWTMVEGSAYENLLPAFVAKPKSESEPESPAEPKGPAEPESPAEPTSPKIPVPTNKKECKWWEAIEFDGIKGPDNVLKDYLTSAADDKLKTYYKTCFHKKNKGFLAALFYTRLFKGIEDGIKQSAYGTDKIEPFQNANFDYAKGDIKWLRGAAWMQVYNTRVRSLFTTREPTKEPTKSASSALLEERIGSIGSNIFQPADLPGTILDLDSFEH